LASKLNARLANLNPTFLPLCRAQPQLQLWRVELRMRMTMRTRGI
jgi:hypothetical protein